MIVVIGSLSLRGSGPAAVVDGLAAGIARSSAGTPVQVVGKIGDDPEGDALLVALARAGIGHAAMLRDPVRRTVVVPQPSGEIDVVGDEPTPSTAPVEPAEADGGPVLEAADVRLALQYLTDARVIVAVHASTQILEEVTKAASWAEAHVVAVVRPGDATPDGLPADALVIAAAVDDAEGVASRIGQYAAAVARGDDAVAAYARLTEPETG